MNVHGYGDIAKRQGLGGLVSDVLGGSDSNSNSNTASASQSTDQKDSNPGLLGGLGGDLNSVVGGLTSNVVGGLTSALSPSTPTTSASASATSSFSTDISSGSSSLTISLSSAPSSSLSSTSSSISSSASSSSQTSSSAPSSITPPPSSPSPVVQTEGSRVITMTTSIPASPSPSSSNSHTTSFLDNKPLEGGVFAVVGIIGLVIIVTLLTMTMRRRRRNKEIEEAVSFAPTTDHYYDEEKANNAPSRVSQSSSSSHGNGFGSESSHGSGAIRQAPLQPTYGNGDMMRGNSVRRMDTYGGTGYGQPGAPPQGQAMPAYRNPSPGAAYAYAPPSNPGYAPGPQAQHVVYPMPPRSPLPAHDPARSPPPVPNPAFSGAPVLPQLNLISATPQSTMRSLTDAQPSGFTPKAEPPKARRSSLLHPSPTSGVGGSVARDQRSYSRELDPEQPGMPVSPALPDTFGSSEDGHDDPYGGVADSQNHNGPRMFKVANE